MSRIIDLKPKKPEIAKPQSGPVVAENKPVQDEWKSAKQEAKVISWSGQLYYEPDIKIVVGIALVFFTIAVLVQIFQRNLITTIFFGLLGAVILLNAGKKPKITYFEINNLGVKAYEKFYAYREIKSFWIEYDTALGIKELSLQLKKWYIPYLKMPIEEQNPVQLRSALLEFIPEIEHQDTLVEILSRKLGI